MNGEHDLDAIKTFLSWPDHQWWVLHSPKDAAALIESLAAEIARLRRTHAAQPDSQPGLDPHRGAEMNAEPSVNTLVYDSNNWMWQRRTDAWVCVTQEVGGPATCTFDELLRRGPVHLLRATGRMWGDDTTPPAPVVADLGSAVGGLEK